MTPLEIALSAFCVVLLADKWLTGIGTRRDRERLLDRIQARGLGEFKALADLPKPPPPKKRSTLDNPADVGGEGLPDMSPGVYPQAIEAARSLME